MKALDIMVFLLIFNVMVSVVGALSIWDVGVETATAGYQAESVKDNTNMYMFIGTLGTIMISGAIVGAFIGVIARRPIAEGAAYGFFAGLITSVFMSSYGILTSIILVVPEGARGGVSIIVGLFLGITGLMFAIGFMQLIRGGVESYM